MNSAMLSRIDGDVANPTLFTIQSCSGGDAFVGLLDYDKGLVSSMGKIFFPEDNFRPFGVHAGQNGKSTWGGYGLDGSADMHIYY